MADASFRHGSLLTQQISTGSSYLSCRANTLEEEFGDVELKSFCNENRLPKGKNYGLWVLWVPVLWS